MHKRMLGNSGLEASAVCFGAWAIGGWMWGGTEEQASIRAIHAALESGINTIDTAAIYGFGKSEELVGKAVADRRDKVLIATKCGMIWHTQKGEPCFKSSEDKIDNEQGDIEVFRCLAPDTIRHEVEESLRRLKTDYIDLYQTHWQEQTTPLEDTVATLEALKQEGKIRAYGACNINLDQIKQYKALGDVASAQQPYSMLDRGIETDVLPYCKDQNIAVLAYSPLALGLLTGKVTADRQFAETDLRSKNPRFSQENRKKINTMLGEFQPLADKHRVTLAQLVIAWTIHQPGLTHALVGARNEKQAQENAAAGAITLSAEELNLMGTIMRKYLAD